MARAIHKPNIIQQNNSPRKKLNRQLGRRPQPNPFICPLTPITATMPKENETESEVPSRKRISLACQRCRKRKIKCEPSNEPGEGQACVACQSAKSPDCQYLRVNSGELRCSSPESSMPGWNFSTPLNEETPFNGMPAYDLSQYTINNFSQIALSTGRGNYRSPNFNETYARTSSLNGAVSPQRNLQSTPHQSNLGSDPYNVLQAHSSLPYHQSAASPTTYTVQEVSPSWAPSSVCGISSMETGFGQNNPMQYDTLQYQGSTYAEEPPYFPALSPLSTHLPPPSSTNGKERCLPAPVQTYLAPNSQYTPETESYNSSSGGTENSSEVSLYEYNPLGSNALLAMPMSLSNLRDARNPQCFGRLPPLDPQPAQRPEYHNGTSNVDASETVESRAPELMDQRGYRFLQPQPRRTSRSFITSSGVATTRDSKKSAAARRQERHNVLRHQ